MGQLVLRDLPRRTKGVLIVRVTVDVGVEGDIGVNAKEAESEKSVIRKLVVDITL